MSLLLAHPELAYRPCDDCQRWMFDDSGQVKKRRELDPATGKAELVPFARPPGTKTPCWNCPKCEGPEKTPAEGKQAELSERNWKAWRFYWEQKAGGGRLDGIARKNCGIIAGMLADHRMVNQRIMVELLKARM